MLKEIHEQADAVAETIGERACRRPTASISATSSTRRRLISCCRAAIVIVACGTSYHAGLIGPLRDRGVGASAGRGRGRVGVSLPQPGRRARRSRHRDLPVGRDRRHARGDADSRATAGATVLAITNVMGSQATRDRRRRALHAGRTGDRRRRDEDVRRQVAVMYLLALRLAELRGTLSGAARRH